MVQVVKRQLAHYQQHKVKDVQLQMAQQLVQVGRSHSHNHLLKVMRMEQVQTIQNMVMFL